MKAISYWEYGDNKPDIGKLILDIDCSAPYEQDGARLYKQGTKYTILSANGCSCWEGNWEGWTDLTKPELNKVLKSWSGENNTDAEQELAAKAAQTPHPHENTN